MSPEAVRRLKGVGGGGGGWAVGVILYELLTGSVPYIGDNLGELFAAILERDAPPVRTRAPHVRPELDAVVLRCLQRRPELRFGSVAELAGALGPFAMGTSNSPYAFTTLPTVTAPV